MQILCKQNQAGIPTTSLRSTYHGMDRLYTHGITAMEQPHKGSWPADHTGMRSVGTAHFAGGAYAPRRTAPGWPLCRTPPWTHGRSSTHAKLAISHMPQNVGRIIVKHEGDTTCGYILSHSLSIPTMLERSLTRAVFVSSPSRTRSFQTIYRLLKNMPGDNKLFGPVRSPAGPFHAMKRSAVCLLRPPTPPLGCLMRSPSDVVTQQRMMLLHPTVVWSFD